MSEDSALRQSYKEWIMAALAVVSVLIVLIEDRLELTDGQAALLRWMDRFIWLVFCVDYFRGLWLAKDRSDYILHHWIELIAILPLDPLMKGFRLIRLLRLLRLGTYGLRMAWILKNFFSMHNFYLAAIFILLLVLFGAMAISYFEEMEFPEALWWAFVTTLGGGADPIPITTQGKAVTAFLMVAGISFLAVLTGTVASYFLTPEPEDTDTFNPHVGTVIKQLEHWERLTPEEVEQICAVLRDIKALQQKENPLSLPET